MAKVLDRKQYVMISIIFAAAFAIYNIIVLPLFDNKNEVFWVSYVFMFLAFAAVVAATLVTLRTVDAEAIFMNIPLLSFSIFYFCAELFVSFVFMLFRGIAPMPLAAAIQAIMLLGFIIFAVLALMSKEAVQSINKNIDTKVRTIKNLSVDVKILEDQCTDKELQHELHKITEAIRFSDPMTTEVTEELDELIKGKVRELKFQCSNNNKNEAMQTCSQLRSYISERNQRLEYSK